ncbi:MAG: DUF1015 domain-containing protein [Actinomycetota bacterium]|nr:DUF1015 domain-containing protein [Actinomycetota bacterium]
MIEIKPFKGLLYNDDDVDLKDVVTPPYDVISKQAQRDFYQKSSFNIIRLILGQEKPDDNSQKNKYTRAKRHFDSWLEKGILVASDEPAIFFYEQIYSTKGEKKRRLLGFIALLKIEDFKSGLVLPHEKTFPKAKADRLSLIRACKANFSQVFSLYSDQQDELGKILEGARPKQPTREVADESGVIHRLYTITDPDVIEVVSGKMQDKTIFIADGHHRYETALNYRNEMRATSNDPEAGFNYVMMMFVNMDSDGLSILAAHRLVKDAVDQSEEDFLKMASRYFDIETFSGPAGNEDGVKKRACEALSRRMNCSHSILSYFGGGRYHLLTLKDEGLMDEVISKARSSAWKRLDVTVLHGLLIDEILGVKSRDLIKHKSIKFTPDEDEATALVDSGEYKVAFLLNPTTIDQVRTIAKGGERMPQKSTYFYPKLITGLVIYDHEEPR